MSIPPGKDLGDVRLGDIVLNTVDRNGCSWIVQDIEGWWNLPEADLPDDPRAFQYDGSYETDGRYKARDITISGVVVPSQFDLKSIAAARQQLLSAVSAVRRSIPLEVDESDASKMAMCRLAGRPQLAISQLNGALVFQIPLRAADPRKYSTIVTDVSGPVAKVSGGRTYPHTFNRTYPGGVSSGILTVNNEGNYDTSAQIVITGPVTNPQIEHLESGNTLYFGITLAITDQLSIDLASHAVLLNNSASRRNTLGTKSRWFTLQPGENTLRFNGSTTGDPSMFVEYQSAWIG